MSVWMRIDGLEIITKELSFVLLSCILFAVFSPSRNSLGVFAVLYFDLKCLIGYLLSVLRTECFNGQFCHVQLL